MAKTNLGKVVPQKGIDYFDGYTPVKGIDYNDGYTPEKGIDYWTEQDKIEIIDETTINVLQQVNGVDFYICKENEIDENGKPIIENPNSSTFYLVSSGEETPNLFIEWIYVNGDWEKFGSATINLTDYVKNTDYPKNGVAGVVRPASGISIDNQGYIRTNKATDKMIIEKNNSYQALMSSQIDLLTKVGLTTNTIELTDEEKTSAQNWLGFKTLTQAEYDALETKDDSVFYFIKEG